MKKALLLGDSIRIAYMPLVQTRLAGIAEVVGPLRRSRRKGGVDLFITRTILTETQTRR